MGGCPCVAKWRMFTDTPKSWLRHWKIKDTCLIWICFPDDFLLCLLAVFFFFFSFLDQRRFGGLERWHFYSSVIKKKKEGKNRVAVVSPTFTEWKGEERSWLLEKNYIFSPRFAFFRCKFHLELRVQRRNTFEMVLIKLLKPLKIKQSEINTLAGPLRNIF